MAESPLNDLNYGRPGLPIYDLDNCEWNTNREPTANILQQVSEWQLAIPASISYLPTESSKNATTTRKDARRLTYNHPQLGPAAKHLLELDLISKAVTSAAATYDPHIGELLSFGTVFLKKFVRPKRIAALPTGPSGSILRLVPLGQQRQGWNGDKSVWLQGPSFRIVDSGYWNEEAAPIQQVTFARTENSNSFLAVRLPSRTVLFRPSYHRGRQAAEPSAHYDLPPSLLSACPILSITLDQTGGVPHADVAFNPDYQFHFGIIDQQGNWSLWQIERRAKRDEYSALRIVRGRIIPEIDTSNDGDGWARIFWAGDSNTVLLCNRRQLSLVNMTGEIFEYLQAPLIVPQRSSDWVLDLKRHPQRHNCFFILTSTRLFLISVTTSSAAVDSTPGQAGARIVFSRRHYRGDEDLTLQMHAQILEEQTCVFITSRLNKLVQVYYFQDHPSGTLDFVTSTDPIALGFDLPATTKVFQICLHPLEYGMKEVPPHRKLNASAQSYFEKTTPFYQLTVVTADLGIYQTVLLSSEHDSDPERLVWRRIVVAKHSLDARNDVDEMDDFIEPNGPDWDAEPESKLKPQAPRLDSDQAAVYATLDCATLYESILHSSDQTSSTPINDIIQQFREMMSAEFTITARVETNIMESVEALDVPDVDEASARYQQLFAEHDPPGLHTLQPIAPQRVLHLPKIEQFSITNLYDTILQDWIAPLPAEITVSVRQAKERLARRVAAEVTLASAQVRAKEEEQLVVSSSEPVSLPVLPSKAVDTLPLSLPTPPQSSVPPSSPSVSETRQPPTNDPLSRLRKHLMINDDSTLTPTVLPPSVSELLSHWQPGTDPDTYDWKAAERATRPETPDEESRELRERERKKKERRDKRQRREDELVRAKTQTGSQSMFSQPAFPRSSPGPTFGGMAASSQVPVPTSSQIPSQVHSQGGYFGGFGGVHSLVPQSQVEPGRFGGRPDKKKKKGKSRVSGF